MTSELCFYFLVLIDLTSVMTRVVIFLQYGPLVRRRLQYDRQKEVVLFEGGQLCKEPSCATCNAVREANSQIVRGTILVFADHESSINPLNVPRSLIWNLHRQTVYFGTSISAIFKGLSTEAIQHCFWRGYVCVRGFDRKMRVPRPLMARLHFPASKMAKAKDKTNDTDYLLLT